MKFKEVNLLDDLLEEGFVRPHKGMSIYQDPGAYGNNILHTVEFYEHIQRAERKSHLIGLRDPKTGKYYCVKWEGLSIDSNQYLTHHKNLIGAYLARDCRWYEKLVFLYENGDIVVTNPDYQNN